MTSEVLPVTTLIALYRTNEMPYHMKRALQNGLKKEELIEAITHIAFYAGWPAANTAIATAQRVFDEVAKS